MNLNNHKKFHHTMRSFKVSCLTLVKESLMKLPRISAGILLIFSTLIYAYVLFSPCEKKRNLLMAYAILLLLLHGSAFLQSII